MKILLAKVIIIVTYTNSHGLMLYLSNTSKFLAKVIIIVTYTNSHGLMLYLSNTSKF